MFGYLSNLDIAALLMRAVVVLIAMTFHEVAHGYAAYKLGDPTAKSMGRLSWNPLRHIDPIGAICMLLFRVGWAKPVMVNPYYFKKPKRDLAIVSLAGPVANFILAFLGVLVLQLLARFLPPMPVWFVNLLGSFLQTFIVLNIGLGVFNLVPIPPLDGSKIFLSFLPDRLYNDIMRHEQLGWIVLMVALVLGVLDTPINIVVNGVINGMFWLVSWI